MALQKVTVTAAPEDAGKRLDQLLAEKLRGPGGSPLSKAKARKLIVAGAVYLNGRRVRIASKELLARARIEAYIDPVKLADDGVARDRRFEMKESDILFEDDDLIAVNKPAGLPTQPTLDEARDNLFALVKRFLTLRARRTGAGEPYLGLHHRLDRDTSGVILFTKSQRANAGVAELFTQHRAQKVYHALSIRGAKAPPAAWKVENYLGKDSRATGKRARFTEVRSGGDFAHTDFVLLESMPKAHWIQASPRTGRTHQIRVHLAEAGLPILGDQTYGGETVARLATRVMLHAASLSFPHPLSKAPIVVESPWPEDFRRCLEALRCRNSLA